MTRELACKTSFLGISEEVSIWNSKWWRRSLLPMSEHHPICWGPEGNARLEWLLRNLGWVPACSPSQVQLLTPTRRAKIVESRKWRFVHCNHFGKRDKKIQRLPWFCLVALKWWDNNGGPRMYVHIEQLRWRCGPPALTCHYPGFNLILYGALTSC